MKKYENLTSRTLDNLGVLAVIYLFLVYWRWYQERRAQILFARAWKLAMNKNYGYWYSFFKKRIQEEMNAEI